ncbi:MAG: hypothetical protein H7Z14_20970 [Anaerolineae bacterium]|nr:hypothetical protein [Phycisphaerae bacterium]
MSIEPIARAALAEQRADANRSSNASCALNADALDLDWTFGRDGALTARDAEGRWITGCSVPSRAAIAQLRKLDVTGTVACFLAPAHGAAIRVALDKLRPEQAIIAIVPDETDFRFILHCQDFSKDVATNRVHFVAGDEWSKQLQELFDRIPGLSIPSQFIRVTGIAPESLDSMITEAQRVFSKVTADRAVQIQSLRSQQHDQSNRLCIVGASQRRLWNDWGAILANSARDDDCVFVDPDDPSQSSALAVARIASQCGAIVTVDISRADAPGIVSDEIPWVTWVTNGNVPTRSTCGARDRLLILNECDVAVAGRAGWRESEVRIAKPPAGGTLFVEPHNGFSGAPFIAIVADTFKLEPPVNIDDFSSHRLLWEMVSDELTANPFAINDDVEQYLTSRMRKLDVSGETLNRAKFISSLIVPAYQRGLVRTLSDAKLPFRMFGKNWDSDAMEDRSTFARELAPSVALLHVFPNQHRIHAMDFASRAVIRPGQSSQEMIRRCRDAIACPPAPATSVFDVICASIIRSLIASI